MVTSGETAARVPQTIAGPETVPRKAPYSFTGKLCLVQLYLAMLKGKKNTMHVLTPIQIS